jgi:hypothetical protein
VVLRAVARNTTNIENYPTTIIYPIQPFNVNLTWTREKFGQFAIWRESKHVGQIDHSHTGREDDAVKVDDVDQTILCDVSRPGVVRDDCSIHISGELLVDLTEEQRNMPGKSAMEELLDGTTRPCPGLLDLSVVQADIHHNRNEWGVSRITPFEVNDRGLDLIVERLYRILPDNGLYPIGVGARFNDLPSGLWLPNVDFQGVLWVRNGSDDRYEFWLA